MNFGLPSSLSQLGSYLPRFVAIAGDERWFKRANRLDAEQRTSPYFWRIVSDYHWLEMAISHQSDVLAKDGCLVPELVDSLTLAALRFAGAVVEIHARCSGKARRQLEGRLRDGLSAESGFAPLYLEMDLALTLMSNGYEVQFPDLDGTANFDIEFSRGGVTGEVECKSLSADAGRRVHRKDFYRFMQALTPSLAAHAQLNRREVLAITLNDRLLPDVSSQKELRSAAIFMLGAGAPSTLSASKFNIERRSYRSCFENATTENSQAFSSLCKEEFGSNSHVAGGFTEAGGCIVVVRSKRQDDTSKPWLEAMRKATTQFSGHRPSFIAVQFQDISAADLLLLHLRRRAGILSYALFCQYGASHVNATYFCGFAAAVIRDGHLGIPAFVIPNPAPKFAANPNDFSPFLLHSSDAEFAAAIGPPLPVEEISTIPL